jgi:hypothetical protein
VLAGVLMFGNKRLVERSSICRKPFVEAPPATASHADAKGSFRVNQRVNAKVGDYLKRSFPRSLYDSKK